VWVAVFLTATLIRSVQGQVGTFPSSASAAAPGPLRILVLFDGRIMEGEIEERPGGYLVKQPAGSVVMPFETVRVVASTLTEAYERQRDNFNNPTTQEHLTLARWCYTNKLYAQANAELEAVLRLEPQRREARELLKLIDAETQRSAERTRPDSPPGTAERTAGGVRTATQADFIRRIQPLLVNKCGNATCHGTASSNAFRLVNVRTGLRHQRLQSDQNLTSVLAQISTESPEQSPLLLMPQDREMLVHRGVFFGPSGDGQIQMLREWIGNAAADLAESGIVMSPTSAESSTATAAMSAAVDAAAGPAADRIPPVADPQAAFGRPKPRIIDFPSTASPRGNRVLRGILEEERPDPFDPEEFNRRVHGGSRPDTPR
jgi:hypothetical protein